MTDLIVHPIGARSLSGSVPVPSDKSIGHRALLFSALCRGKSRISGFSFSADNVSTADALRAMGVRIETTGKSELTVEGVGLFGLRGADKPLDCGNSGTTMRLITGILAAQSFGSKLIGDASLSKRPMMRIVGPLRARGARIEGAPHPKRADDITAPLEIHGLGEGDYLGPLEYESPVASAQIKSAILLSGLFAHGATHFKEPTLSRDHTERMLSALGVPLRTLGTIIELDPAGWSGEMPALDVEIVGDASAAAFLLVAAQLVPGSRVVTRGVGTNPTRTGLLEILRDMGAGLSVEALGERAGEPIADIHAWSQPLRAATIGGETVARAIDEIPIACALAARASGTTSIRDAEELRVKESDRIATMATVLRGFGIRCEELPDGLQIEGSQEPLEPSDIDSHGDHRIAMTATVLGLLGRGATRVRDVDCVSTSFPRFVGTLRGLGAQIDVDPVG
ncbi:MAG TPA: 3-phosphoshikimate 1-carboxyvinyltransferase [Polyangiaceae bacterium]|nr:3-phosphoshikimate 1-carboxyvinyltransferase [Polyangiaceae bacterium]